MKINHLSLKIVIFVNNCAKFGKMQFMNVKDYKNCIFYKIKSFLGNIVNRLLYTENYTLVGVTKPP